MDDEVVTCEQAFGSWLLGIGLYPLSILVNSHLKKHSFVSFIMRVIGEIPHPQCKITLFHWNNRYLIKLEQGLLEQTYKVPEWDLTGEGDLKQLVSDQFIKDALERFQGMESSLKEAVDKIA